MRALLIITSFSVIFAACVPMRAVKYLVPDLADSSKFENVRIAKGKSQFQFESDLAQPKFELLKKHLDSSLIGTKTKAFLVIKNDTIIYQHLADDVQIDHMQASFSMAKAYVGTLIGIAVDRGQITATDDLVIKYLPALAHNDERFKRLTIQQVLDMRSGLDFKEKSYSPFSQITRSYYGADLRKIVQKLKFKNEPGKVFEYQSINTQILAFILEKVTGKTIDVLLKEDLWQPLGAQSDALWSVDKSGNVKAFCCISATALDYAKLGRLYLHDGNWQGKQIVSRNWVEQTTNPEALTKLRYKNQLWATRDFKYFKDSTAAVTALKLEEQKYPIEREPKGRYFYAKKVYDYKIHGMFQQTVYVNPLNKVIIVRLGDRQKKVNFHAFVQRIGRSKLIK